MKIKSEQDVEILDQRIQSELGVDVKKYRNDEVVETFMSMLVFIEYFITWVIGPVVGALIIYGLGFWLLDLVHVEYGIYGLIGLILFLFTGLCLGLLLLTGRMKEDVWGIIHYSLDIMKSAKEDTKEVMANMPAEQKKSLHGNAFSRCFASGHDTDFGHSYRSQDSNIRYDNQSIYQKGTNNGI